MNWPKVDLKNQRYESFRSCFGARKKHVGPNFPIFQKNCEAKEKIKENKRQIRKRKKENKF